MERIKNLIRRRLTGDQGYRLLHFISRNRIAGFIVGLIYGRNLQKLAIINNTDKQKVGRHDYMSHYQAHLSSFKYRKIKLLEIGVGGYERADRGGCSLRMWKRYFPCGKIYAIDIYDKSPQEENRIKIFKGSQTDHKFLDSVLDEMQTPPDIIIDDGSHINAHVIDSFQYLFPKLNHNGVYVVEDTETSYREDYGGDSKDLENPKTSLNFFKKLTDAVNQEDFDKDLISNGDYFEHIQSIHFYRNLIFIHKKLKEETIMNLDFHQNSMSL